MRKFNEIAGGLLILILGTLLYEGWSWVADRFGSWLVGAAVVLWLLYTAAKWILKVAGRFSAQKTPTKAEDAIVYGAPSKLPHIEESSRERAIRKAMDKAGISREEAERQLRVFGL